MQITLSNTNKIESHVESCHQFVTASSSIVIKSQLSLDTLEVELSLLLLLPELLELFDGANSDVAAIKLPSVAAGAILAGPINTGMGVLGLSVPRRS